MRASSPLDSVYLNRCHQEAMNSIVPHFDRDLRNLAETTADRIAMFPQRFARERQHYQQNAAILLLSPLWITTKVFFLKCGLLKHPCQFWKLCPYCSHKKRMDILAKFLPVFESHPGRWGFVTLSFKRCHYCGDCYVDNLEVVWDACRFAFQMMVDLGEFEAAFLLEEFQVLSYFPVPQVLAHVHVVVLTDEISMVKTERLKKFVRNYPGWVKIPQKWVASKARREQLGDRLVDRKFRWMRLYDFQGFNIELSTRTYQIRAERDLCGILGYLVKPIDWSKKYMEEWDRYCASDHAVRLRFNQNVDRVIETWQFFSSGRNQHLYLGTAHHARTGFIGIEKKVRVTDHHKRRTLVLLEDCNDTRLFGPDDLGEALELTEPRPGPSGEQRDEGPKNF